MRSVFQTIAAETCRDLAHLFLYFLNFILEILLEKELF